MTPLTPAQARERGRIGGYVTRSRYTGLQMTRPAHRGQWAKWEREVAAEAAARGETLAPAELAARTTAKQHAHTARMRLARANRAPAPKGAPADDLAGAP